MIGETVARRLRLVYKQAFGGKLQLLRQAAASGRRSPAILTQIATQTAGCYGESFRTALNSAQAQPACRSSVLVNRIR